MKIIINENHISATATDYYNPTGYEQAVIAAPEDFDVARLHEYVFADGVIYIPLFNRLRIERDTRINSVLWMRERHVDELELGKGTSLTPEQYAALLTYIQALRDIPQQEGAPWDGGGELTPWPIKPV